MADPVYRDLTDEQRIRLLSLSDEQRRQILAFFIDYGDYLAKEDEWSMDDNFSCAEMLYALHCELFPGFEMMNDG